MSLFDLPLKCLDLIAIVPSEALPCSLLKKCLVIESLL